jgi:hypothetical protein
VVVRRPPAPIAVNCDGDGLALEPRYIPVVMGQPIRDYDLHDAIVFTWQGLCRPPAEVDHPGGLGALGFCGRIRTSWCLPPPAMNRSHGHGDPLVPDVAGLGLCRAAAPDRSGGSGREVIFDLRRTGIALSRSTMGARLDPYLHLNSNSPCPGCGAARLRRRVWLRRAPDG